MKQAWTSKLILVLKNNKINIIVLSFLILHSLLSGRFWMWNLLSIIPPITFLLIFFFLILWNIVTKNEVGIIFIILSIPFVIINTDYNIKLYSNKPGINSTGFKVFNWNTEYWQTGDRTSFYKFLKDQDADVYHLQEHINQDDSAINDYDELKKEFKDYEIITKTEFVTMTRLPVLSSNKNAGEAFLRVDVMVKNNPVSLYNIHMPVHINPDLISNPINFLSDVKDRFYEREKDFSELENDLKSNSNDIYISGDFNTTKSMGKMFFFLNTYKDSYGATSDIFPATWVFEGNKLWRIDYNFVNKGINILDHKNIDPQGFSDHWGQLVTAQL